MASCNTKRAAFCLRKAPLGHQHQQCESRGSKDRIWDMLVAPTPRHPQTQKPHLWVPRAKFSRTNPQLEFLLVCFRWVVMASLSLCLPPRLCVHHLHWSSPLAGLLRRHQGASKSVALVAKQGSIVSSPSLLRL